MFGEAILELLHVGKTYTEIQSALGCSRGVITHWRKKGKVPEKIRRSYDWVAISEMYAAGYSMTDCANRFGFSPGSWTAAVNVGKVRVRPKLIASLDEIMTSNPNRSRGHIKRRLKSAGKARDKCDRCGVSRWMGEKLSIQLHHKNGIKYDHREENLEWLCPNCHSLTDTFCGRNNRKRGDSSDGSSA